jgi:hypothetical protein
MTTATLKEKPVRDLAKLAKQQGVPGWHAMRKDQLIKALVRRAKAARPAAAATTSGIVAARAAAGSKKNSPRGTAANRAANDLKTASRSVATAGSSKAAPSRRAARGRNLGPPSRQASIARRRAAVTEQIRAAQDRLAREKSLVSRPEPSRKRAQLRDRAVLMVRGPHWLHAFWEVTPQSVRRVEAAMGQEWHAAKPTLRLLEVVSGAAGSPSERVVREIEIHGGVKNWFIDVRNPLRCRIELGYRSRHGEFHPICRSNIVNIGAGSQGDSLDAHWGDIATNCDKIYAMSGGFSSEDHPQELQELFEERLKRPLGPPDSNPSGLGESLEQGEPLGFPLEVEAEMIVYGVTEKGAYLTIQGEPVEVEDDGGFRVRVEMPNKRQVIPIMAQSATGLERQTVVLAIERNTKAMEPHLREADEL